MSDSIDDRLKKVFCEVLHISADVYNEELSAGDIQEWDSLGHVNLLQAVEDEFNIAFDVTDALELESVKDFLLLVKRYLGEE
ncbi:MAG: acyl carrier protein [Smithellaceae bacterium]